MTWKQFVWELACQFCDEQGSRTFRLPEFVAFAQIPMQNFAPNNSHREAKLRQTLQYLRDDGRLNFVDGQGTYTLTGLYLLRNEVVEDAQPIIQHFSGPPAKREYLVEVFARDRGWVKKAKSAYGTSCFCPKCSNSFLKEDGSPYCEVHHIVPLCEGGNEELPNLSILCAHHHRMAHFAADKQRQQLRDFLLERAHQLVVSHHLL